MEFRQTWKKYNHLEGFDPWFEVFDLGGGVYAIYEPYHFQEVISYLITGTQQAVLWDTGMGISNIKTVVDKLTDKPVTVINSHVHFDHVGDNHRFEKVLAFNHPPALNRLRTGYTKDELLPHTDPKLFDSGHILPADFEYVIKPCQPSGILDGTVLRLGGREIKVLHTPGHSHECIMLYDQVGGELFTGDSYYPGWLYAHFSGDFYGDSVIADYADSLEMASRLPGLKILRPSHNEPFGEPAALKKAARAMSALAAGEDIGGAPMTTTERYLASLPENDLVAGYIIQNDLYMFDYEGVRIIARKQSNPLSSD